ncbi:Aste57867_17023 [Aphanomyces stellatus]|uniref:Aste57867_17023 protein n=1 Tax=Aphanomyces stellatus TaxID=120398 RepID=A0A485L6T2_9STRA|nr:hypothetical protein As57867_016965 [Aphanomyces stellatus]VFT93784.1 Aste57867_17023 [Aphanomyces stellatus]
MHSSKLPSGASAVDHRQVTHNSDLEAPAYVDLDTPRAAHAGLATLLDVPKMQLSWTSISMSVQVKDTLTKQLVQKQVLTDVHGSASSGQLVVLMGPSGAGKTSLLDIVSGRNTAFTGSVLVNGRPWTKQMNKFASYVMQDDIFYHSLTVREHLLFQAKFRMGATFSTAQRTSRVDHVIHELGLTKCKDTIIGNQRVRGISGGERKRLSFATEILTNPSLLFVDEPTSGLDSFMAESVVLQLQKLARDGRTVLATIHQPSSELFTLFDQLYLLSDGRTIYNGKAADAVPYFASQGLPCPTYMNPTDYFMRQIIVLDKASDAAIRVAQLAENWTLHGAAAAVQGPPLSPVNGGATLDLPTFHNDGRTTILSAPEQFWVLCQRNVLRLVRDQMSFQIRVFSSLFIAVVVGLIYLQLDVSQTGVQSFTGVIFFIVVNQFFSSINPEFLTVPLELPILRREYRGGLYHIWVWYAAKNISELGFQLFFPMVFVLPLYFMVGFAANWVLFWSFYLFTVLVCSAAVGLGYLVSCIARSPELAPVLGIVVILPFLIFGGLFINSNNTPAYLSWVEAISPMKYAFRGMSRAFWTTIAVIPCNAGETCTLQSGDQVLASLGLNKSTLAADVGYLLAVSIGFRLAGLVFLVRNTRKQ